MTARPNAETVCDRLPEGFTFPAPPTDVVTMCAWTRRIRIGERWVSVEEFLWERFRVRVTHGISEDGVRLIGDLNTSAQ